MALKSHTIDELRAALAADPTLKVFDLDSGTAGEDDVLLGRDLNDVRIDLAVFHGWDDDPENWTRTERGWEAPSVDGDGIWVMNPETGLPVGWSLRETTLEEEKDDTKRVRFPDAGRVGFSEPHPSKTDRKFLGEILLRGRSKKRSPGGLS